MARDENKPPNVYMQQKSIDQNFAQWQADGFEVERNALELRCLIDYLFGNKDEFDKKGKRIKDGTDERRAFEAHRIKWMNVCQEALSKRVTEVKAGVMAKAAEIEAAERAEAQAALEPVENKKP